MKKRICICLGAPVHRSIFACLALVTVCSLFLLTTLHVEASTVTINDQAFVLDAGQVQAVAAQLPDPILIYTTDTFTGDQNALNTYTRELLPNQTTIAIGIDTVHRHLSIEAGTNVQLSNSEASDAYSVFRSTYENGGDYTGATIAALYSILGTYGSPAETFAVVFLGILLFIIGIVVVGLVVVSNGKGGGSDGRLRGSFWGGSYSGGGGGGGGGGGSGGGAGGSF